MNPLTFGSLFAGIGGFDLGFERAGLRCKWQVEINEFCRKVLAKHWPNVRRHDDVKTFPPEGSDLDEWRVDVICGGFPCQDISVAGKGAGIADGTRSGLWSEYVRILRVVRPRYVVVENVSGLLGRGLGRVLGDLAACGYDAEWDCIPAKAFGAPYLRDRVFIIAHRDRDELRGILFSGRPHQKHKQWSVTQDVEAWDRGFVELESVGLGKRCDSYSDARGILDGIPNRVDRLRGLGNVVVPQVAQWLGERLIEAHIHEDASDAM